MLVGYVDNNGNNINSTTNNNTVKKNKHKKKKSKKDMDDLKAEVDMVGQIVRIVPHMTVIHSFDFIFVGRA